MLPNVALAQVILVQEAFSFKLLLFARRGQFLSVSHQHASQEMAGRHNSSRMVRSDSRAASTIGEVTECLSEEAGTSDSRWVVGEARTSPPTKSPPGPRGPSQTWHGKAHVTVSASRKLRIAALGSCEGPEVTKPSKGAQRSAQETPIASHRVRGVHQQNGEAAGPPRPAGAKCVFKLKEGRTRLALLRAAAEVALENPGFKCHQIGEV